MGKYRDIIRNKRNSEDDKPTDDWVYLSDVEELIDTLENAVNNAIKSAVKDATNSIESEFSEISDGLY